MELILFQIEWLEPQVLDIPDHLSLIQELEGHSRPCNRTCLSSNSPHVEPVQNSMISLCVNCNFTNPLFLAICPHI